MTRFTGLSNSASLGLPSLGTVTFGANISSVFFKVAF